MKTQKINLIRVRKEDDRLVSIAYCKENEEFTLIVKGEELKISFRQERKKEEIVDYLSNTNKIEIHD